MRRDATGLLGGPSKCYVTQLVWVGVSFPGKKNYEGVRFNVISVTTGWVRVKFPGKKRYVGLPLNSPYEATVTVYVVENTQFANKFCQNNALRTLTSSLLLAIIRYRIAATKIASRILGKRKLAGSVLLLGWYVVPII